MRIKMRFETEDAAERRYIGKVTQISDMDPLRWPDSKWRCISVRWDDQVELNRHNRVSPWEIEPSGSGSSILLAPGSKRTRINVPSTEPDFPVQDETGFSDFGESLRFRKVLQGQEILGFNNHYDVFNHHPSETRRCLPGSNFFGMAALPSGVKIPLGSPHIPYKGIGFGESVRFHKVLQGQEIFPEPQFRRSHDNDRFGTLEKVHTSIPQSGWSMLTQGYNAHVQPPTPSLQVSSPSSVLKFQHASPPVTYSHSAYAICNKNGEDGNHGRSHNTTKDSGRMYSLDLFKEHDQLGSLHQPPSLLTQTGSRTDQHLVSNGKSHCRLFGFPLTEETHVTNEEDTTSPITSPSSAKTSESNCTKVHKQGSVVDRVVDLTKLDGYANLITVLERMFNMEGLLNDYKKGWQVVYTDHADHVMIVGDDPWLEFCNTVSKILIYTHTMRW